MEIPKFVKYGRLEALVNSRFVSRLGDNLEVFEKLDGGNCQVRNIGGWNLLPGSKANFLKGKEAGVRPWFQKFTKWIYSNSSLYQLPEDLVLFGEWSGNHTISYAPENADQFFVIDVLDLTKNRFMKYEEAQERLKKLGIEDVRYFDILLRGRLNSNEVEDVLTAGSNYYNGPKEGLVIKSYDFQRFYKLYHPDFSEVVDLGNGKVDYLTPARFRKAIYRVMEEQAKKDVNEEEVIDAVRGDLRREHGINIQDGIIKERFRRCSAEGRLLQTKKHLG